MPPNSARLTIELPDDLAARITEMASAREVSRDDLLTEAVRAYVEDEDAYLAAIDEAIIEADKGVFVSGEKVEAWLRSLGTENELPIPEPDIFLNEQQ
jgi:predicted transcriptional regulator